MTQRTLTITTRWGKPVVAESGGEADLLIRIAGGSAPGGDAGRAPVDVALVIDRSGSMGGGALDAAKDGVSVALDRLDARDRAALVVYDNDIDLLHELAPVTERERARMRAVLQPIEARGSTNLGDGWLTGCRQLAGAMQAGPETRLRRTILLTDGQANVGITRPAELARHASALRSRGVMTTTLGFGNHFDEGLLSAMAEAGGGNFEYIATTSQLVPFFARELGELLTAVATNLTLKLTLPHGLRGEVIGRLPSERVGKTFTIMVGEVPAGESVDLLVRVTTARGLPGQLPPVTIGAQWIDTADGQPATWQGEPLPLVRTSDATVAATASDPEVAEMVALQRAAQAQREALLLDRQGRHAESRHLLADMADLLASAPHTASVIREHGATLDLASMSPLTGFSEADHKRTTSRASRAMRGRKQREEGI